MARELASRRLEDLGLSPEALAALNAIQRELADAYRDRFIELTQTLHIQASALDRIQRTLEILVEHVAPTLKDQVPAMLRIAAPTEPADVASAVVLADPIGMGFTLGQTDLARALNLPAPEVSILARALKLIEDESCAVVVRRGKRTTIVNYNPRAAARFRELVESTDPKTLQEPARSTLRRVRAKFRTG